MIQITGHAQDAMKANWVNGLEEEMTQIRPQLQDLITTTMLSAANSGIQVQIDSLTAYAGLTRGAISWFESYEAAINDIISYSALMTAYRTLRDNDIAAKPDLILCPWNQKQRIYQITGQPAIKYIGPNDAAAGFTTDCAFAGVPVEAISDLTDTVILYIDRTPGNWVHIKHRDWSVKPMAPSGDSDVYQISYAGIGPLCRNPKKQGKNTGCTA